MCFRKKNKKAEVKEEKVEVKEEKKAEQPKEEVEKEEKETVDYRVYHIAKRAKDGKWQVKFQKGQKAIKLFDTQAEAIEYAKTLANNQDGSIQIHKRDGSIRKQDYSKK